jgi:diaminopimelate epimerase
MSDRLPFVKMQGAGNDFVVLDGIRCALPPLERLARRMADRHFGVGFDQLLVVRPAGPGADFRMEIYNADGSRAEMCANGIRAFLKYLRDHGHTDADEVRVETLAGVVVPRLVGPDRVRVQMGRPVLAPAKIPTRLGSGEGPVLDAELEVDGERVRLSSLSMGNPHAVIYVADVDAAPVKTLGPRIEAHPAFPNRTNVEFVQVLGRNRVRQRTWERGTGETLACGTGACAVAVASILRGVTERALVVELRGGELELEWPAADGPVSMTGPAAEVFRGTFPVGEEGS